MIAVILLSIVCGIAANELCEFGPWCARKLVRWSAFRRYANPERAEIRAEELTALIDDRPGNLFKLFTAVSFAGAAVIISARRAIARESDASAGSIPAITVVSHEEVLERAYWYLNGEVSDNDCELIRQHLDKCEPCLRAYGLEEAVKRLVAKHVGCDPVTPELRTKVLVRIRAVQDEINLRGDMTPGDANLTDCRGRSRHGRLATVATVAAGLATAAYRLPQLLGALEAWLVAQARGRRTGQRRQA